jgi:hypothetical protein
LSQEFFHNISVGGAGADGNQAALFGFWDRRQLYEALGNKALGFTDSQVDGGLHGTSWRHVWENRILPQVPRNTEGAGLFPTVSASLRRSMVFASINYLDFTSEKYISLRQGQQHKYCRTKAWGNHRAGKILRYRGGWLRNTGRSPSA